MWESTLQAKSKVDEEDRQQGDIIEVNPASGQVTGLRIMAASLDLGSKVRSVY